MRLERQRIGGYAVKLVELGRPPSRGGNTKAWHSHSIFVEGTRYSFIALGAKKWGFKDDLVSFDWEWDKSEKHRNVRPDTLTTISKEGEPVIRGMRGWKRWRVAPTRLPVSRREARD